MMAKQRKQNSHVCYLDDPQQEALELAMLILITPQKENSNKSGTKSRPGFIIPSSRVETAE